MNCFGGLYLGTTRSIWELYLLIDSLADNTNANQETRAYWTALAKEFNVPIRCIHFLSPPELCKHNNAVRASNKEMVRTETNFSSCEPCGANTDNPVPTEPRSQTISPCNRLCRLWTQIPGARPGRRIRRYHPRGVPIQGDGGGEKGLGPVLGLGRIVLFKGRIRER